jgi:hypothetical protein
MVDTEMQALIRRASPEALPSVERFQEAKRSGTFNTPEWVADAILEVAFGETGLESGSVLRVPDEWEKDGR